jgi:hypothetical protein
MGLDPPHKLHNLEQRLSVLASLQQVWVDYIHYHYYLCLFLQIIYVSNIYIFISTFWFYGILFSHKVAVLAYVEEPKPLQEGLVWKYYS